MNMRPNEPTNALDKSSQHALGLTGAESADSGGFSSGAELGSATAPAKVMVPQQVFVFLIVFAVSAATIFTMRQYGMRAGIAAAEEVELDYQQADAEKARTYERIMSDLRRVERPLDVALQNLRESPFMPEGADTTVMVDGQQFSGPSAEELAARARAQAEETRKQLVQSALTEVKINMVLGDMARINNEYYRVGDQVGEYFTIVKIDGRSVTIQADGVNYVLLMDEKVDAPGKGPSKFGKPRGN